MSHVRWIEKWRVRPGHYHYVRRLYSLLCAVCTTYVHTSMCWVAVLIFFSRLATVPTTINDDLSMNVIHWSCGAYRGMAMLPFIQRADDCAWKPDIRVAASAAATAPQATSVTRPPACFRYIMDCRRSTTKFPRHHRPIDKRTIRRGDPSLTLGYDDGVPVGRFFKISADCGKVVDQAE